MTTMNPTTTNPNVARPTTSTRPISEFPDHAAKAVELLSMRSPSFALASNEAACIVALMRLVNFPAGTTVFSAGDETNTGYMLLVLEGDISVDTGNVGGGAKVDISVLGPGALIGELALIDGSPRSATCTAVSGVTAAGLSAAGLQRLTETHPQVAAKLAIYIARNAGDRLRSLSEQLQMYDQLTANMQREIDQLRIAAKRNA
jgi:CRP/FNR family cyclic AMP-dependent transcriptional regulator